MIRKKIIEMIVVKLEMGGREKLKRERQKRGTELENNCEKVIVNGEGLGSGASWVWVDEDPHTDSNQKVGSSTRYPKDSVGYLGGYEVLVKYQRERVNPDVKIVNVIFEYMVVVSGGRFTI